MRRRPLVRRVEVAAIIEEIADEGERCKFRKAIGIALADVYAEVTRPIIRQYPDLDPEKDR